MTSNMGGKFAHMKRLFVLFKVHLVFAHSLVAWDRELTENTNELNWSVFPNNGPMGL